MNVGEMKEEQKETTKGLGFEEYLKISGQRQAIILYMYLQSQHLKASSHFLRINSTKFKLIPR